MNDESGEFWDAHSEAARVDGTYPFDNPQWKRVRKVHVSEVVRMLGLNLSPMDAEKIKSEPDRLYLFLNKGFLILGDGESGRGTDAETRRDNHRSEIRDPNHFPYETGTRAVYCHDGKYSIIEVR